MSRHFGDMLLERRRQMGASIQQVSNIVRIKPQIIEYFETENFAAMPPRGYAQGMIASYARFLGLNAREVVDAYFDALHEYEHGNGGRVGRFQDAASDANPRSSNAPARYMMVNAVPSSRFAQRPPQAGYVSESNSPHEPISSSRLRPAHGGRSRVESGYDPSLRTRTNGRPSPAANGPRGQAPNNRYGEYDVSSYRPDSRAPRNGAARAGRGGAYRSDRSGASARSGGRPPQGRGGAPRSSQQPFDARLLIALAVMALLVLVLGGFLLLRGCAPKSEAPAGSALPAAADNSPDNGDSSSMQDPDDEQEEDPADDEPASDDEDEDSSASKEPKETVVKISLKDKGCVAWVEVKLDGKIVLGKQVVGPFEEQFTVTSQIDITTDSPSSVAIYKNGDKVRYDTKVSGVGKVSITAPKRKTDEEKVVDSDGDGTLDMTASEAEAAGLPVPTVEPSQDAQ